jgi:peptide/nickel transport system substrate-binding protein
MRSNLGRRHLAPGVLSTVLLMALLVACGGEGDGDASSASGEPVTGGTLNIITTIDGLNLDPAKTPGTAANTGNLLLPIFDTLVRVDINGEITPRIATSVESQDQKTWSIELREGVTFSDGTPFDAEALKSNWERAQEPTSTGTVNDAKTITSMAVISPTNLEVTLEAPSSTFPYLLQGPLGMIGSPTAIEEMGEDYSVAPVGAGPYLIDKRVTGSSYTYKRNPNFWEKGRPYADNLNIKVITQTQQAEAAFKSGEGDMLIIGEPLVQRNLEDAGFKALVPDAFGGYIYAFNNTSLPTSDVRVRRAITMAVDPEDASEKATQGAAKPQLTLFPEGSPYHAPEYTWPFNGDVADAQALIDSYVAENGPIKITWDTVDFDRPWADAIAEQVESKLDNIEINVGNVSLQKSLDNLYSDQFRLVLNSFQGFNPTPTLNNRLLCDSGGNNANYCNKEVDVLLKQAAESDSLDERVELYGQVQKILTEDLPFFPQSGRTMELFVNKSVKGAALFADGYIAYEAPWLTE